MSRSVYQTMLRLLLAGGCFGFSFWAATTGYREMRLTLMVSSVPLFVVGALAIWTPLFALLTRPLLAMVDSLFFPGGKLDKPTLNLKLPAYLINEGRFTEALEEYESIMRHYPNEVEPYEKSIWLHVEIFKEPEKAHRVLKRAQRRNLTLDERLQRLAIPRHDLKELERKAP